MSSLPSPSLFSRGVCFRANLSLKPVIVAGLGAAGTLVSVKRGYGRNFLLPQGFALYATEENITKYGDGASMEEQAEEQAEDDAASLINKVRA